MIRNMFGQCHAPVILFRQCFWLCFVSCCFLWFSDVYCHGVLEGHPVLHPLDCWPDHGYDFCHPSGLSWLSFYSDLGLSQHSFTKAGWGLEGDSVSSVCMYYVTCCKSCVLNGSTPFGREREREGERESKG